jgi:hypothetical protein
MNRNARQDADSRRFRLFGTNSQINFMEKAAYKSLYMEKRLPASFSPSGVLFPWKHGLGALFLRKHGGNMGGGVVFPRFSSGNEGPWIPCFRRVGAVSLETRVLGALSPPGGVRCDVAMRGMCFRRVFLETRA